MDAGKRLDEEIATRFFGWRNSDGSWVDPKTGDRVELRPFSTDVSAAWLLADRICEDGFRLQLDGSRIWQARFYKSAAHTLETRSTAVTGKTPAVAICLAALSVRGITL